MKQLIDYTREHSRTVIWLIVALVGLAGLLLYKLGSLTGGLSAGELSAATMPVGWSGIYHQPLYLPLQAVRSVVFWLSPAHGQTLTRLPNALFGGLTVLSFACLLRLWHGMRTTILASVLFACSAWVLHASRLASFDVLYLWTTPALLLIPLVLKKYSQQPLIWYGSLVVWGFILYIPGLIWLVVASMYLQREALIDAWRQFSHWWQRVLYALIGLVWLVPLGVSLTRPGQFRLWLGLPAHLATPMTLLKQFVAVPLHLFVRGPQYPDMWLARTPIMDVFTLLTCVVGIYFYATHWRAARTRLLGVYAIIGLVLVGLGGPVGLSLLIPLLYIGVATGVAYLLRQWLRVFPRNPFARGLGLGLIFVVVGLSCVYNLRAYFVAWPHDPVTQATFQYHR